jgi:DNA processing protein
VLQDDDEFAAWFRLLEAPGVSRSTARALLAAFGSADAVIGAGARRLGTVAGGDVAQSLTTRHETVEERLAAAQAWRQGGDDRHVVVLGSPAFPPALLQTVDPPLMLYVQGQPAALAAPGLAIVGSRNPTPQGSDNARAFATHLSNAGLSIVSGLALGVDGAAHDGALAGRTPTIAVVGTGLDRVYPSRHRQLAHRIAAAGAIVSEFAPGTPPLRENFPLRNRIIAGMTRGTLVVEAALQSGSLITARLASEAGREVFAIPGSIHSPQSRGCHLLIKQGAKLVESADDVLEELRWPSAAAPSSVAAPDEVPAASDALLAALGHDPATLDALGARTGLGAAELAARLLDLELAGQVARLPGGLYQRRTAA